MKLIATLLSITFLLRIRFPKNKPLFEIIRSRYGESIVKNIRKWEKTAKKLEKAALDVEFLCLCSSQNVIPKFLKFKLYRENLHSTPVYRNIQQTLLENEIKFKRRALNKLKKLNQNASNIVKDQVND